MQKNGAIDTKLAYLYVSDGLDAGINECPGSLSRSQHGLAPSGRESTSSGAPKLEPGSVHIRVPAK
jgi:hypothetical protein